VDRKDSQGFAQYLAQNGRLSLPLAELLETFRMAVAELIDVLGRTGRVSSRRDGKTARRRVGAAFPATEKKFRRILGCRELWRLRAKLGNEGVLDSKQ